ncbi:hypothetical protein [Leifsonia sp. Leaf264]|uniref:hypothetical protein n=1 Tax=Leifsonia sp. Leaf264 TaxID=1736314 RepID=UPI0006FBE474|nr:hypothetical protein [Leifsonia sp. Leaf264]KQO97498.1 hypothetical protein ASF30_13785 [Leifsonia sp. Leaf264]
MNAGQYRPTFDPKLWTTIEPFVSEAVADALPQVTYRETELYVAIAPFVRWSWETAGMPLDRLSIFNVHLVERYVAVGLAHYTVAGRGTMRSRLLRVCDCLVGAEMETRKLRGYRPSDASRPYTAKEITILKSWAKGLSTSARRHDAEVILALGIGAGLSSDEINRLRVEAITSDDVGTLIDVFGAMPRRVPVEPEWERVLTECSERLPGDAWAISRQRGDNGQKLVTNFIARTRPDHLLTARRMRATWIVHHLNAGTALIPLLRVAGLNKPEALDRFLPYAGVVSDDEAIRSVRLAASSEKIR